ncbi:MAG: hypothetical protein DRN30_07045 [Thermoplasmata archaeon]|nr:MAG: hypothetical protein DRN30_07045 [Thermoplasmata archaeon]
MISKVLRALTRVFFNAMFSGSDSWAKHVPMAMYILETYLVFKLVKSNVLYVILALLTLLALYVYGSSFHSFLYVILVSAIPAVWYFVTSLPFTRSLEQSFIASMKAFTLGAWTITIIHFANPMEFSYFIKEITKRKSLQVFFPMIWRIIPHMMSDLEGSLLANDLKGEKSWKGLAVAMLATKEYEILYSEGLISKITCFTPKYWYELRGMAVHLCIIFLLVIFLIFPK